MHSGSTLLLLFTLFDCSLSDEITSALFESLAETELNTTAAYQNDTEEVSNFNLAEAYLPLQLFLSQLNETEIDQLELIIRNRHYAQLKAEIEGKIKTIENSDDSMDRAIERGNHTFTTIISAYHNASIYNTIRSIWLKQIRSELPLIDQIVLLNYFSQRKEAEYLQMSIWERMWSNFRAWFNGNHELSECQASEPRCIRNAVEAMEFDERMQLDTAATENHFDVVDTIVRKKLNESSVNGTQDLEKWLLKNQPPTVLQEMIAERTDAERQALQRLREAGIFDSLRHYYKAVIEARSHDDQMEIRDYFDRMNTSFARCFDPLRGQLGDF